VTSRPSLQDLTLSHSQRLSEVYRTRDGRLAEAQATRDLQLRALPGAAKAYQKYDDELASAREKQLATEARAAAARTSALLAAADHRADLLEDAQLARRGADLDAVQSKRRLEDAAEAKFRAALDSARERPEAERSKALQDANRTRRLEFDQAKRAHDELLSASQQKYRGAVDAAVISERRENRDSERAYFDALRTGEAAARAARTAADQNLLAALAALPEAREILRGWRRQVAAIGVDAARAEEEEFSRFRRDLQTVMV
jgi:hypothetical protein